MLHQLYIGIDKKKRENIASGRGVRGGGIWRFGSGRGQSGRRNFKISNKQNMRQEMIFYPHGTGPDQ